jgi:hypothetical protein
MHSGLSAHLFFHLTHEVRRLKLRQGEVSRFALL